MQSANLLIGSRAIPARKDATFDRINPYDGSVATRAAAASVDDADAAVAAAQAAFPGWSTLSAVERRQRMLQAAAILDSMTAEFVQAGVAETGGTPAWYGFNMALASSMLREAASMTTQIAGEVIPSSLPGSLALAVRRPCGVVLGIAPWNAPVILGMRAIAMPLACGNTVVLKGSELCPAVHSLIGTAFQKAGLGDGVVNVVLNAPADAPAIVERLIANPAVRRVNFTGSTPVGRIIGQIAARHLKPALLELGGKAPLLVLDDADLDAAAAGANFGAFVNQGQICMSTDRIVVDDSVADSFVQKLVNRASPLVAGDPRSTDVALGTMITAEAATRVGALVQDALDKGGKLVLGGGIQGAVMQPTILDHVTSAMKIYSEESFGPVVAVLRASGEADAIRIANDTVFGLSSAVFTKDAARGLRVASQIESGMCHINGPTVHDEANMPFGGVKDSGYGRFGGKAAIAEFTNLRWITVQTEPRHYPF